MNSKKKIKLLSLIIAVFIFILGQASSAFGNMVELNTVTSGLSSNLINGHRYALIDESKTWDDAKLYAESLGGHLATITTQEEQTYIESILGSGNRLYYWIGAADEKVEGKWEWVTGEPFAFTNWQSEEPNGNRFENHLMIYRDSEDDFIIKGKWNDSQSGNKYFFPFFGFIVEWESSDATKPITEVSLSGVEGTNYWFTSDVTISLKANDNQGGSGIARTDYSFDGVNWTTYSGTFIMTKSGETDLYYRSVDKAGNIESTKTVSFKIDKTAPVTSIFLDGTLGNNGWYVSDVKVTMTATDNQDGSGVSKTEYSFDGTNWITYSEPFIMSTEGSTTLYYRSVDNAGNIETVRQEEQINVDVTTPTTEAVFNNPSGNGEWANSGQVTLTVEDGNGSGGGQTEYSLDGENWIEYEGPINIDQEGETVIYYRSEDSAGNKESFKKIVIKIDKTPPIITGAATKAPNANGWYNNDVTVHFTASDAVSGVDKVTPDTIVSTEGVDLSVTGTAVDKAGNTARCIVEGINIDKTTPEVVINIPAEGAEYKLGQNILANWSAADNLSGIVSAVGTVASGQAIDTSSVGLKTFTVVAEDKAGNRVSKTVYYRILYAMDGIPQSLDGKTHKLGSTIPVKFTLKDANGSFVTDATAKLYIAKIVDGSVGDEQEAVSTSSATTGNLFRYDNTDGHYMFNLSTKDLSTGTWQLRIALDDGSSKIISVTLR